MAKAARTGDAVMKVLDAPFIMLDPNGFVGAGMPSFEIGDGGSRYLAAWGERVREGRITRADAVTLQSAFLDQMCFELSTGPGAFEATLSSGCDAFALDPVNRTIRYCLAGGSAYDPSWSADGVLGVFQFEGDTCSQGLYLANLMTISCEVLLDQAGAGLAGEDASSRYRWRCDPAMSPDGNFVAFSMLDPPHGDWSTATRADIWIVEIQTRRLFRLTWHTEGYAVQPTWAPDSARVCFLLRPVREGGDQLLCLDLVGHESFRVHLGESAIAPQFHPVAELVLVILMGDQGVRYYRQDWDNDAPGSIAVVEPHTGKVTVLTDGMEDWEHSGPVWLKRGDLFMFNVFCAPMAADEICLAHLDVNSVLTARE